MSLFFVGTLESDPTEKQGSQENKKADSVHLDFCLPLGPLFINILQSMLYLKTSLSGAYMYKTLNPHC